MVGEGMTYGAGKVGGSIAEHTRKGLILRKKIWLFIKKYDFLNLNNLGNYQKNHKNHCL
jgi:hypothetical protein